MIIQQALFDLSAEDPRLAAGVMLFNLLWCAMVPVMDVANILWGSQLFNHYLGGATTDSTSWAPLMSSSD